MGTFYNQSESQHIAYSSHLCTIKHSEKTSIFLNYKSNGQRVVTQELGDQIHKLGIKYKKFSHVK